MSTTFTYTAPVSIFPSTKIDGTPSRRLVLSVQPSELESVPADLFAVKVSQSKNPQKKGTLRFKYFAFKANDTAQWSDQASTNFNVGTPVEEIKAAVVAAIGANPEATVQFTVNMPGKFANIETSDGRYSLFDFNENPDGNLGYYLKGGTVVTVTFTESEHKGNLYYRLKLEARDKSPEELFVRGGRGKIFGQEDAVGETTGASVEQAGEDTAASIW